MCVPQAHALTQVPVGLSGACSRAWGSKEKQWCDCGRFGHRSTSRDCQIDHTVVSAVSASGRIQHQGLEWGTAAGIFTGEK